MRKVLITKNLTMANSTTGQKAIDYMYQCNLQKSKLALHVNGKVRFLNKREQPFIFLIQDLFVGKDKALN